MLIQQGAVTAVDFSNPAAVFNGANALKEITLGTTKYYLVLSGDMDGSQDISANDFLLLFLPNFGLSNPGEVPEPD